jgi:hypothetical protein
MFMKSIFETFDIVSIFYSLCFFQLAVVLFIDRLVIETKGLHWKEKKHVFNMILKKKLVEHGDKIHHEEDLGWEDQPFEMQE